MWWRRAQTNQVVDGLDGQIADAGEVDGEGGEELDLLGRQRDAGALEQVLALGRRVAHAGQVDPPGAQGDELLLNSGEDVRRQDEERGARVDDDAVPVQIVPRQADGLVAHLDVVDLHVVPLLLRDLGPLEVGVLAVVHAQRQRAALGPEAHREAVVEVVGLVEGVEHGGAGPGRERLEGKAHDAVHASLFELSA